MNDDVRTRMIKGMLVQAERRSINQRTLVGMLRMQLAEAERKLGECDHEVAEVRSMAVELGIDVSGLKLGHGTLHDVLTSVPE